MVLAAEEEDELLAILENADFDDLEQVKTELGI